MGTNRQDSSLRVQQGGGCRREVPCPPLLSSLRKRQFEAGAKTIVERRQGVARAALVRGPSAIDNLKAHGVSVDDKYLPKYAQRIGRTQSILASVES